MNKTKQIKIVLHVPDDSAAFEQTYIEATLNAIRQLAETTPKHKAFNPNEDNSEDTSA